MEKKQSSPNNHTVQDSAEREKAVDPTRNIHCESPAGSGKTTLLTQRFIKLLPLVRHPQELLALTFTNKAAGEMRERIWNSLKKAEKRGAENSLHHLRSPDDLRIMTFHSLCLAIVRSSPLEAEVTSNVSIIEGVEYDELLARVIDETLRDISLLNEGEQRKMALEQWLLRMNNNWERLRHDCMKLIKRRDYLKDLIALISTHEDMCSFREQTNKTLAKLIEGFMEKARSALLETDLGRNWDSFAESLNYEDIRHFSAYPPDARWPLLPQWQRLAEILVTKEGTPRKRFAKEMIIKERFNQTGSPDRISALQPELCQMLNDLKSLPVNGYEEGQINAVYDLIILLGELISDWQERCRQKGVIDFVGLELACLKVFSRQEIPDIQLILDSSIQHILVDEFQDTSRNQWELLQKICTGWTASGGGRTIFIVGDPKQSIYAFRKAEVSLFFEAKKGLPIPGQGRLPLESITLKNNFRSSPGLIEWINDLFSKTIMANPRVDMNEVPFSPSIATLQGRHTLSLTLFVEDETTPDPQMSEAEWLAESVKELDRTLPEGERIGILLFARTRLAAYLQAFKNAGISLKVTEGRLLKECSEVMSFHQMVKALVRPHDDLAWVSLIRSLWCWCSADILCQIAAQPHSVWSDKIGVFMKKEREHDPMGLPELWEKLQKWWEIVQRARIRVGRDHLSKIAKDAWLEIEGAYQLTRFLGAEGVKNILAYLELLENSEQYIPEETLTKVEKAIEETYIPASPEASRSRIELMTVHKAKGLEFDYVFCPYLDWDPLGGSRTDHPPYLLETLENGQGVLAVRKDKRQKEDDLIYKLLLKRRQGRERAEAKRLFYVAVTRAKKGLFLSGVGSIKEGKISVRCKDSPLGQTGTVLDLTTDMTININPQSQVRTILALSTDINSQSQMETPVLDLTTHQKASEDGSLINVPVTEPFPFSPERVLYRITSPSKKEEEEAAGQVKNRPYLPAHLPEDETQLPIRERARGIVTHQILARIAEGEDIPSEKAITAALYREGLRIKEGADMAHSIAKEIRLCMEEAKFSWIIRQDHAEAYSEWSLEDSTGNNSIRSGIIDRLIYDGTTWWIIDYKTVQKEKGEMDAFLQQQAIHYKSQMDAYRGMVAHWKGISEDAISVLLYFTAFQKSVSI